MQKVLIITDLFYASPRIPGLCKYLPEYGWEATLLTTPLGKTPRSRLVIPEPYTNLVEVPYNDVVDIAKKMAGIKKNESALAQLQQKFPSTNKTFLEKIYYYLFLIGGSIFAYPDEMRSWRIPAIIKGKTLLKKDKFTAILSSSFPVTSHRIASALSSTSGVPWLADLRDLWTQNHNYLYPWRRWLETQLEISTLQNANVFSTVSESLALKLKKRYPKKNIVVVNNGFDPELINEPKANLTSEFTITYTGLTYQGKQNPAKLFVALRALLDEKIIDPTKIKIRFYGVIQKWITQLVKLNGLEDIVTQYGPILRQEAISKQRESQLLLLFGWEDIYETGVLPLKMYEYFAARRPILAIGGTPLEQFRQIFDETHVGNHAIHIEQVKNHLKNYYLDYLTHGQISYMGRVKDLEKYCHRHMAQQFANALNIVCHSQYQDAKFAF